MEKKKIIHFDSVQLYEYPRIIKKPIYLRKKTFFINYINSEVADCKYFKNNLISNIRIEISVL